MKKTLFQNDDIYQDLIYWIENIHFDNEELYFDNEDEILIKTLNNSLNKNNFNIQILNEKWKIYNKYYCYRDAIRYFDLTLSKDLNNFDALLNKWIALFCMCQYSDAIQCFESALKSNNYHSNANYYCWRSYMELWKYQQAINFFNNVSYNTLEWKWKYVESIYYKSQAYLALKNYSKALHYCNIVLKNEPDHGGLMFYKIWILCLIKNYKNALKISFRRFNQAPNSWFSFYDLSCVYSLMWKKIEAIQNLERSFDLNSFEWESHRNQFYSDSYFDSIKDTTEFQAFLKKLEDKYGKPNSENQKTE